MARQVRTGMIKQADLDINCAALHWQPQHVVQAHNLTTLEHVSNQP